MALTSALATCVVVVPSRVANHEVPALLVVAPARLDDLGAEPDVLAQAEPVDATTEVVEQHALRRVELRPVARLREGVAVEVVLDVDPAAGIVVLEPRAADVGVLLEHDERHARLPEAVRGGDARHARPDDRDGELPAGRDVGGRPRRRTQIDAVERELLLEQHEVLDVRRGPPETNSTNRWSAASSSGGAGLLPRSRNRMSASAAIARASASWSWV